MKSGNLTLAFSGAHKWNLEAMGDRSCTSARHHTQRTQFSTLDAQLVHNY